MDIVDPFATPPQGKRDIVDPFAAPAAQPPAKPPPASPPPVAAANEPRLDKGDFIAPSAEQLAAGKAQVAKADETIGAIDKFGRTLAKTTPLDWAVRAFDQVVAPLGIPASAPGVEQLYSHIVTGPLTAAVMGGQSALGERPPPTPAQALSEASLGLGRPVAGPAAGPMEYGMALKLAEAEKLNAKVARTGAKTEAIASRQSGYAIPPKMGLEKPPTGLIAKAEGLGGKYKIEQEFSDHNQDVTNSIAARDLGLPPNTKLTPDKIEMVREQAGKSRGAIEAAIPMIEADQTYLSGVNRLTGRDSEVYKYFGETKDLGKIEELQQNLLSAREFSTKAALDRIGQLRLEATQNFRVPGDNAAHALGVAQRQAADLIEDLIDRRVSNAPAYFESQFKKAGLDRIAAQKQVALQQQQIRDIAAQNNADPTMIDAAAAYQAAFPQTLRRLEQAEAAEKMWLQRLTEAREQSSDFPAMVAQFRKDRRLMAKTYDVEAVTNPVTGDVSAVGLAGRARRGRPLTGGLKEISDFGMAFPRAAQVPSAFGGVETHSNLDFFGAAMGMASGHPEVMLGPVSRPIVRGYLMGPRFQNRLYQPPVDMPVIGPPQLPGVAGAVTNLPTGKTTP